MRLNLAWLSLAALLLSACRAVAEPAVIDSIPAAADPDLQQRVLAELSTLLEQGYLYADHGGVEWEAEAATLERRIAEGLSDEEFRTGLEDLLAMLPSGTASYFSREERVQADFDTGSSYEGIGAFVAVRSEPEPRIVLLSVIEPSPAARAGLRAHDAVYAVDGAAVTQEEGLAVIQRVRGPAGTEVVLEVASPAEPRRLVTVERGEVAIADSLRGGILAPGLIYLLVPVSTDVTLFQTLAGLLQDTLDNEQDVVGLVLDLRIAGASSGWPLTEMLSLLGDGQAGYFNSRSGSRALEIQGTSFANSQDFPLVILVGPDTSGAPEVFAAALQAVGRAPVIGLPTSGSVLSYQSHILPDGSLITFAESTFITPDGTDLSLSGLTPDVVVELDWDQVGPGADPVLSKALELLQNEG